LTDKLVRKPLLPKSSSSTDSGLASSNVYQTKLLTLPLTWTFGTRRKAFGININMTRLGRVN